MAFKNEVFLLSLQSEKGLPPAAGAWVGERTYHSTGRSLLFSGMFLTEKAWGILIFFPLYTVKDVFGV